MVTYDEYFADILNKVLDSHRILSELDDKRGDLNVIRREVARIDALLRAVARRVEESANPRPGHVELAAIARGYVETYSFGHEIDGMAPLYAEDTGRIRGIRLKILESFEECRLTSGIRYIMERDLT